MVESMIICRRYHVIRMYRHIPPGPDTSATSVLTSASLVRSSDDENVIIDNLTVGVAGFPVLPFLANLL
jgi:hypothetical protein